MSLYGNIKKIGAATFQFDRVYSTRKEMDEAAKTDGVYAGRYVLVEYGERYKNTSPGNSITYINKLNNYLDDAKQEYYDKIKDLIELQETFSLLTKDNNIIGEDSYYKLLEIFPTVYDRVYTVGEYSANTRYYIKYNDNYVRFTPLSQEEWETYVLQGNVYTRDSFEDFFTVNNLNNSLRNLIIDDNGSYDKFKTYFQNKVFSKLNEINAEFSDFYKTMAGPPAYQDAFKNSIIQENSDFRLHERTDLLQYGATYDSTVWQKTYIQQGNIVIDKYIMVAELNAKAPQFDVKEEAPLTYELDDGVDAKDRIVTGRIDPVTNEFETVKLVNAREKYNQAYFDSVMDTEQRFLMHYPHLLEVEASNDTVNYNENGFNMAYSYNLDNGQTALAFIPNGLDNYEKITTLGSNLEPVESKDASGNTLARLKSVTDVNRKKLYLNFPSIGNTMKILYDLIYGFPEPEDGEDLNKGILRPYFRKFSRTIQFHNYLTVVNNNGETEYVTLKNKNDPDALPEKIEISGTLESENQDGTWSTTEFNQIIKPWSLLYGKTISPSFIVAKFCTNDNRIINLPTVEPNASDGYAFLYDLRQEKPVTWTMRIPNGEDDPNLDWMEQVPELKDVLKNNSIGLANVLIDLFKETNPLTGEISYYLYNDWAADNNGDTNTPMILNKPYTIGGYATKYITYPNESLADLSGGYWVDERGRAIAVNKSKVTYSYTDTKVSSDFTDGHYNVNFDTWQLINTPKDDTDLTNTINLKANKILVVPNDANFGASKQNQDSISVSQYNNDVLIYGNISKLRSFSLDGVESKWIGLDIKTGQRNIKNIVVNGRQLDDTDIAKATASNLTPGHIALWIKVFDYLTEQKINFSIPGYDPIALNVRFDSINDITDILMNVRVNLLTTVPDDENAEEALENQRIVNTYLDPKDGKTVLIEGNLDKLNLYDMTPNGETSSFGHWVGIDIDTGLPTIVGASINNIELTEEDVSKATALGLPAGHVVIWEDVKALQNTKSYLIKSSGFSDYVLLIRFNDIRIMKVQVNKINDTIFPETDINYNKSQKNQRLTDVVKYNSTDYLIIGDLKRLNDFTLSDYGLGKWVLLDIETDLLTIKDAKINDKVYTEDDVQQSIAAGLDEKHLLLWVNIEELNGESANAFIVKSDKYHDFYLMLKFVDTTNNINEMNVVINKIMTSLADDNQIVSQQNQDLITVTQTENDIVVSGDLTAMNKFTPTNLDQIEGFWIGLDINTGLPTIVGTKINGTVLTEEDADFAIAYGLHNGHIAYWVNAEDILEGTTIILESENYYDKTINLCFKQNTLDIDVQRVNLITNDNINSQVAQQNQNYITVRKENENLNSFIIEGNFQNLTPYVFDNDIQNNAPYRWVGITIDFGLDSIIGVSINDRILTKEDEDFTSEYSLPKSCVILWYAIEDLFHQKVLTINASGYKETKVLLQAINTNSNKLDMNINIKKITTMSSSLLTDNVEIIELAQDNQDNIIISQNDNEITLTGSYRYLNKYALNTLIVNNEKIPVDEGKWILLDINTGLYSIEGMNFNNNELKVEDIDIATSFNLKQGHILHWINVDSLLAGKTSLFEFTGYNNKTMTFYFNNTDSGEIENDPSALGNFTLDTSILG